MTDDRNQGGLGGPGEPGTPWAGGHGGAGGAGGQGERGPQGIQGERGPQGEMPPGITQDEIDFYRAQRQEDIRTALKHFSRRALAGFLILLVGVALAIKVSVDQGSTNRKAIVQSGRVVSVAGCNRDFKSISSLRGILIRAQVSIRLQHKAGVLKESEYDRAVAYYQKALDDIQLPDCRKAENVVTDDPTKPRPIPEPLYPGGPGDPEAG